MFLESQDITLKRLQEASRICGNIPRECFTAAESPDTLQYAKETIQGAIKETDDWCAAINKTRVGGETIIHRIFQLRPSREHRRWNDCFVEPVSDLVLTEIMDALDERRTDAAYELYCAFKGCSDGNTLAGKLFEHRLHPYLKKSSHRTFTIQSLDNPSATLDIRSLPTQSVLETIKSSPVT